MIRDYLPWLLWSWAIFSPLLFRLLPGRDAAIACLVVGWAFLPVAPYPDSSLIESRDASDFQALAVPTSLVVNKATAIGLGCLAGLILFDRKTFRNIQFGLNDLPMAAWCLVPLVSTLSNGLPLAEGLAQVRYLALAWGVPYLMGRAYLTDSEAQARFAVGLVAGGLAYLPLCLLEIVTGPAVYRWFYGPHPYEFEGAARFLGSRPLGFMEHGNQLGIWMASSAVLATWLWASGAVKRPGGVPGGVLSSCLIGITLLCQSHASILLMGLALLPLLIPRIFRGRMPSWKMMAAIASGLVALGVLLLMARKGFSLSLLRADTAQFFRGIRKTSFSWRLARTEDFLPIALQRPWLGWGRANWRPEGLPFLNPVNLPFWLLALGIYGVAGLSASMATWLVPLTGALKRRYPSKLGPSGGATGALVALVVLNFLDGFSNSTMILPVLAAVASLNQPPGQRPTPA